jgi:teichuronic acid biosynthesis glycosyltransferase TuaG|tara:strand:- start:420 stop:1187 length:768 start_codon:yes stop_codon:yes gene_type:complete
MKNELISIITPTYNSSKYLQDTIKSIISQTYEKWELIITDDCSTDETVAIIKTHILLDSRIKLYQLDKNSGSASARNNSIKFSKGVFLAFLDSDDLWEKDKLNKQLLFMKDNNFSFSFTGYSIINDLGIFKGETVDTKQIGSFSYKDMLAKKATLGCSTVMLYKKTFEGLLNMPLLRTGQDYAFWLKLLKNTNQKAHILPIALTQYRINPNSISRNKIKKAKRQWTIYRNNENLNLVKSSYYFCFYAFRAIFRTS